MGGSCGILGIAWGYFWNAFGGSLRALLELLWGPWGRGVVQWGMLGGSWGALGVGAFGGLGAPLGALGSREEALGGRGAGLVALGPSLCMRFRRAIT